MLGKNWGIVVWTVESKLLLERSCGQIVVAFYAVSVTRLKSSFCQRVLGEINN